MTGACGEVNLRIPANIGNEGNLGEKGNTQANFAAAVA
jgi:hypothetical protein